MLFTGLPTIGILFPLLFLVVLKFSGGNGTILCSDNLPSDWYTLLTGNTACEPPLIPFPIIHWVDTRSDSR